MKSKTKQTRADGSNKYETKYDKSMNDAAAELIKDKKFISMAGLAIELGIAKPTLYAWKRHYPEFAHTMTLAQTYLENRVYEGVELGSNATFAIFNLKNNHKAIEHSEQLKIDQKERELDARINGEITDDKEIVISFTDAVDPKLVDNVD